MDIERWASHEEIRTMPKAESEATEVTGCWIAFH